MIRMGTVWDRTVEVLQGRTAILASLGALYIFLPNIVGAGVAWWAAGADLGPRIVSGLVQLAVIVLLLMGLLAITAVATDPAVTRDRATGIAASRLLPMIGVVLVIAVAVAVLFAPAGVLFSLSGAQMTPAGTFDMTQARGGMIGGSLLFGLLALIVGLIVSAKLAPLMAVIANERLGLGAIARSWRLTRGSTARLVGVILLYAVVLLVVMAAVNSVTGIIARLLLGPEADGAVTFIVAVASAVVTTIASVVQTVFYGQFYVAARDREAPGDVTRAQ